MMIFIKNKTAYFAYAAHGFEPCTLRFKECLLLNQTTRPPTMLVAHINLMKK